MDEPGLTKFTHAAMLLGLDPSELSAALASARAAVAPPAKKADRLAALPRSLPPIGLSREIAAAFIDVSPTKFDQMVADGRMPKPKRIDARRVWARTALERSFAALPSDGVDDENKWEAS